MEEPKTKKRYNKGTKLVNFGGKLLAELREASDRVDEDANMVVRACVRLGLAQLRANNYLLLALPLDNPAPPSTARKSTGAKRSTNRSLPEAEPPKAQRGFRASSKRTSPT